MTTPSPIQQVLELARWAPSGDNTQPWRFEILSDNHAVLHGFDTRDHCVYDFQGRPSQLALGALMETLSIAATGLGLEAMITPKEDSTGTHSVHDVVLQTDDAVKPGPLIDAIKQRSVQRRPMSMRALTADQKKILEQAAAPYTVVWRDRPRQRLAMASLLFVSAKLRLTSPEAYEVHRSIIAWRSRYSEDKVPDQALGLDSLTLRLMEWVMASWARVRFFNTYLAGTYLPRLQLDFLPGVACAAHFALLAPRPPQHPNEFILAGRAVQRFWLTATHLGLQLQPEMTPLIFSWYHDTGSRFSHETEVQAALHPVRNRLGSVMGEEVPSHGIFMGRVGFGPPIRSRSLRLPLPRLRF